MDWGKLDCSIERQSKTKLLESLTDGNENGKYNTAKKWTRGTAFGEGGRGGGALSPQMLMGV